MPRRRRGKQGPKRIAITVDLDLEATFGVVATKKKNASEQIYDDSSTSSVSPVKDPPPPEEDEEDDYLVDFAANNGVDTSSCPCCGELFLCGDGEQEADYFSQTETESSGDEDSAAEMDTMLEMNRMNILLFENARTQRLLKKNINYAKILALQKSTREKQTKILQRTHKLNTMFTNNIECVLRLGVCAVNLQRSTDGLSDGLINVHNLIQDWDTRLAELAPIPKKYLKDDNFVLPSVLDIFKEKFGTQIDSMTSEEFDNALKISIDAIPDLLPDSDSFNKAVASLDIKKIGEEWDKKEKDILTKLDHLEVELVQVCVAYGVRRNLPKIMGYEWAHAMGNATPEEIISRQRSGRQKMVKLKNGKYMPALD